MKIIFTLAVALLTFISVAHADTQVQMSEVLIDARNCNFVQTAFTHLSSDSVTVNAQCVPGSYRGSNGNYYTAKMVTSMIIHGTYRNPVALNNVLLGSQWCAYLQGAVTNLSTTMITVQASCSFGSFVGRDASTYGAQVTTSMYVHSN